MFKKFFSDSIIYAIGPQLPKLAGLFLLPILTKYLTTEDYAIWGIATAYSAGLYGFRDLGFAQVLVNFFFKHSNNEKRWILVWRQLFGVLLIWGVLYGVLLSIILYFSLHKVVQENIWELIFYIVFPAIFFDTIAVYGNRIYQFKSKPIPIAINATLSGIITIVVNYLAVVQWGMHYMSFFIALFFSSLFNAIYFFWPVFIQYKIIPIIKVNFKRLKPHLKIGLPTIPHTYSSYLLNASDRVILDVFKQPLNQIGEYNFAYSLSNYVELVGSAMGMAISPIYSKLFVENTHKSTNNVRIITFGLQFLFIVGTTILSIWTKEILSMLSSNIALANSYPYAIIIVMGYVYRPMYWVPISCLGIAHKTNQLWKISFVGGIINVVLNVLLIPFFGIYAVVFSTFIGLMYIGFSGFYLKAFKELNPHNYYPVYWLVLIITCTVGVFLIRDCFWVTKILVTMLILIISSLLIWKNRNYIKELNF
ncbi:oligosaccharide flippase family protein [Flavobacterium sp.]|uniref:oligosaccharide flippase family protein n=1 Tax=Flavobacterium sp. TaxID=239 RepID=UPI0025BC8551|nr:oligosaccharide flippase family protein [Flavobacterium sp.]